MSDQNQILRDDIAFMRELAEAGRSRTVRGGSVMVAAGAIFGTASLLIWAGLESHSVSANVLNLVWPVGAVLFFICLGVFLRRIPGERSASLTGMAWSGLGWAIFTCVCSLILIAYRTGQWAAAAAIAPVILSVYGAAWCIAGAATRTRWLYVCGAASFVAALINAWAVPEGNLMFLLYGLSLYALVAAPGVRLIRQSAAA
jgi:hypothetical protein